jgi:4-hydroxy-3-polyprenylbenzoate decarboxylase
MFPSLRSFLQTLEQRGELLRVQCPVSPLLEVAEIANRACLMRAATPSHGALQFDPRMAGLGGRALLFERVEGSDFPLVINAYGSYTRVEMALGCSLHSAGFGQIAQRIASMVKLAPPRSLGEAFAKARELAPLLRIGPRRVRRGVCQQVVKLASEGQVDLHRLPIIKCWPHDGDPTAVGYDFTAQQSGTAGGQGRYITMAGMHTIHADDRNQARPASHNIGMYRSQLLGPTTLAMHWHMHHDGASHWRSWKALGQRMPIAICLGGESVLPYGATAPLPPGVSELLMCGFLNGRGIPMVRAKTVPLWVPANSEIVIEGWVSTECGSVNFDPATEPLGPGAVFEGPFGDHTGFYSLPDRYPVVDVTAITHRRDAVYPTTIVGLSPQEDYYLGKATERIFLPLLQTLVPDIHDYHLPQWGCFHNAAFIRIAKHYPLQARRVMSSIWGAGQMAWTKTIFVFDADAPIHDESAAMQLLFERCNFLRDTVCMQGPLDILDHAAPWLGAGTKMGFDCTSKTTGEAWNGVPLGDPRVPTAPQIQEAQTAIQRACASSGVRATCSFPPVGRGRLCVVHVDGGQDRSGARDAHFSIALNAALPKALAALPPDTGAGDFVIAVDRPLDPNDWASAFFLLTANGDPGRDMYRHGERIAFDATRKHAGQVRNNLPTRRFPELLSTDAATRALVERRWREYGFAEPPPDPRYLER